MSFKEQKFFSLMNFLKIYLCLDCTFDIISEKSLPSARSQRFLPVFSSRNFTVSDCTFRSVIHFELMVNFGFRPFVGKIFFLCWTAFCTFVKSQLTTCVWICFWTLPFHQICMSALCPVSHCFDYCGFLVVWLLQLHSF